MKKTNTIARKTITAAATMLMPFMLSSGAHASDQQGAQSQSESYQPNHYGYHRPRRRNRAVKVDGFVAHGVNVFNDQYIADYTATTPNIPFLMPSPPLHEVGVLNPGASDSEVITAQTDESRLVATNSRFAQLFGLATEDGLFNIPLGQVASNFFGSSSILDRTVPLAFDAAGEQQVYRRTNTIPSPTLGEWNKISGRLSYRCDSDDSATVKISVVNAFPNAVYTLWDVGASNPLTAQEAPYGVPLGGVPNTILTDDNGCATTTLDLPYCPGRSCEAGAASCTSYLSMAHHWDQQTYGASPAASFFGLPAGAIVANHIVWPISATTLQEPSTKWSKRLQRRTCR